MTKDLIHYYRELDLEQGASLEEVKQAYRLMVKVWHPDRFYKDAKLQHMAQEKLKKINAAYDVLQGCIAEEDLPQKSRSPSPSPAETKQEKQYQHQEYRKQYDSESSYQETQATDQYPKRGSALGLIMFSIIAVILNIPFLILIAAAIFLGSGPWFGGTFGRLTVLVMGLALIVLVLKVLMNHYRNSLDPEKF